MSEQSKDTGFISNVPGHSGEAYVPAARVIDVDPNQVAIAHELRQRGADELMRVTGQGGLNIIDEAHQYPEAPDLAGESSEESPFAYEVPSAPAADERGISADVEPVAETAPVAPNQTKAEAAPNNVYDEIVKARAEQLRGNLAPKFGAAVVTSAQSPSE